MTTNKTTRIDSYFRNYLKKQGFIEIHITKALRSWEYNVKAKDTITNKQFEQTYSIYDMECILKADKLFWKKVARE